MNLTLVVAVIAVCYVSLLFLLAWGAERWFSRITKKLQVGIYGLSLAVYCSSWSFLGTVGQSAKDLWSFFTDFYRPNSDFYLRFWHVTQDGISV